MEVSRDTDIVGRYGGDEFIIVLPETDSEGARNLAERIRTRVKQQEFSYGRFRVSVTLSLGVGTLIPRSTANISAEDLVRLADDALYEAKEAGRDQVACLSSDSIVLPEVKKVAAD